MAANFFVKKPERVEALLFIMTLCLTVYAALEYRVRQELLQQDQSVPNQLGKPVQNPTTRWIFALFTGIHIVYGIDYEPITLNIKPIHTKILTLFGSKYLKYYLQI